MTETPKGLQDHSEARLTQHALERFAERFHVADDRSEIALRNALRRVKRIGRNPRNGAVAVLGLHRGRVLVAILQGDSCLTVLTWPQFEPRLAEFGRAKMPRKRGRMLKRLVEAAAAANEEIDPHSWSDAEAWSEPDA